MRTDKKEAFAERLRTLMHDRSFTQMQLASQTGVAQSRISEWRGGKALPQPRVAEALAKCLGVSADWLLSGEGEKQPSGVDEPPGASHEKEGDWKARALQAEAVIEKIRSTIGTIDRLVITEIKPTKGK